MRFLWAYVPSMGLLQHTLCGNRNFGHSQISWTHAMDIVWVRSRLFGSDSLDTLLLQYLQLIHKIISYDHVDFAVTCLSIQELNFFFFILRWWEFCFYNMSLSISFCWHVLVVLLDSSELLHLLATMLGVGGGGWFCCTVFCDFIISSSLCAYTLECVTLDLWFA